MKLCQKRIVLFASAIWVNLRFQKEDTYNIGFCLNPICWICIHFVSKSNLSIFIPFFSSKFECIYICRYINLPLSLRNGCQKVWWGGGYICAHNSFVHLGRRKQEKPTKRIWGYWNGMVLWNRNCINLRKVRADF